MIEATIDVPASTLKTIQGLLRSLLEAGAVDAWLVPMLLPTGNVVPMLVTDPAALDQADPLTPVLPINAARAASQLTMTAHKEKLGLVLRACEIRALVELVKFQQASLDNALIVGLDCLGTYAVTDWQQASSKQIVLDQLLAAAVTGDLKPYDGLNFRAACQMCEQPLPHGDHVALTIGLLGVPAGKLFLRARDDLAQTLGLTADSLPQAQSWGLSQAQSWGLPQAQSWGLPQAQSWGLPPERKAAAEKLIAARTQARDAAFAAFRQRVSSMDGLLQEFATCIRCHNCMINCPICYCRECIFRTPTFEHESQLYYQWAERKGAVRLLPDTLLFHLTRLNHMATSCVGCGVCADACPVEIPVGTIFRAVADKVQAIFDYHPGRSLEEVAPVQEFREDELTMLGERPR